MKLYVNRVYVNLNDNDNMTQGQKNVTLFVDEEVRSLECQVPNFMFHKEEFIIRAHRKDGSTVKLVSGPQTTSIEHSSVLIKAEVASFRVPVDLVAFSCSAQRTSSSGQWLENRINVTIQGFPLEVIYRSSESSNRTLKLTSGAKVSLKCKLTGCLQQTESIQKKLGMWENYMDFESKSVIRFIRFHQVAGEHLICKHPSEVQYNYSDYANYFQYRYIFNLAPSAPKIYKPPNRNNKSSAIHLIYHDEHILNQTIFCTFHGDSEPVIMWMKNGQEFLSEKWWFYHKKGKETMKQVRLQLDAKTIQPSDFNQSENGQGYVNFSCIMNNYFGSDRLDFIITTPGEFTNHPTKPETTTTTTEKSKLFPLSTSTKFTSASTVQMKEPGDSKSNSTSNLGHNDTAEKSKTVLLVTVFFVLSFILLLISLIFWKKRLTFACSGKSEQILTFHNK